MKRLINLSLVISIGLLCASNAVALDKKALGDSLSVYANQFARVGKVKVNRIRVDQDRAEIFTSNNLSYLSLSPEQIDSLHQIAVKLVYGDQGGECYIFSDGYELSELDATMLRKDIHYTLPPCRQPLVKNTSRNYLTDKGLEGFHIALYGSHGLYFNQKESRWTFQRARLLTTVEDLYTSSYTMPFLVPMLENAGAVVIQPRERDTQLNEVIVDPAEDEAEKVSQKTNTDTWHYSINGGFSVPEQPLSEGENPFTTGGYYYAESAITEGNMTEIIYRPEIPEAGEYAVYISYKSFPNSTPEARYQVMHNGIKTEYLVNQKMGGSTWIYLGTFYFSEDERHNYVSISNYAKAGMTVTTDAVRFGGGMGSVARYPQPDAIDNVKSSDNSPLPSSEVKAKEEKTSVWGDLDRGITSGFPRYIEGARYWMQYSGIPDSVYNFSDSKNDYIDDYASRGRWINWLIGGSAAYPRGKGLKIPVHLGLAFHTDAGLTRTDSIVGTLVIYMNKDDERRSEFPTGVSRLANRSYADIVQTQLVNDIRATFAPEWQRRELMNSSYSEARNPMTPMVLLELLSHQNPADMKYGLDPRFRFTVSRAIYKAMLLYLHEQYGSKYIVQPLPVKDFSVNRAGNDSLVLTWQERPDTLEPTAKADYYVVYTREEGFDWDNGIKVDKCQFRFVAKKDTHYDFRVAAGNRGGISFPSETLSARISSNEAGRILIVNGFDRISAPDYYQIDSTYFGFTTEAVPYGKEVNFIGRQYECEWTKRWKSDDNGGFGASYMDHADLWYAGNTFDYPALHGRVLDKLGYSYTSTSASALQSIGDDIQAVDYILGKQKQTTIGAIKQTTEFASFTPETRQLLSDYLNRGGNLLLSGAYIASDEAADSDFLKNILHIKPAAKNATRSGKINISIPKRATTQTLLFTEPNQQTIHCENPDGIAVADKESRVVARYKDSFVAAGVAHIQENGGKTLVFSFPLESVNDFEKLYTPAIKWINER